MVGEKITGKYICESKKLNLFIFTHALEQNSSSGTYHNPAGRKKLPISPKQHFLKIYLSPAKEGEENYELKK